jgi:ElaA protein
MAWIQKTFSALTSHELYEILKLRSEVFVVEQNCIYLDMDDKDAQSLHLFNWVDGKVVAYARILPPGLAYECVSIGRVIVHPSVRHRGMGRELMARAEEWVWDCFPSSPEITIMAQCYLEEWYGSQGYVGRGEEFLEDGLPHRIMGKSTL